MGMVTCEFPSEDVGIIEIGYEGLESGWFIRVTNKRKFELFEYMLGNKENLIDTFVSYADAIKASEKLT